MARRKTTNKDLPMYMARRIRHNKRGDTWTAYYYTPPKDKDGKKRAIPLGTDLNKAKVKWAEMEGKQVINTSTLLSVLERYFEWAVLPESGLAKKTVVNYKGFAKNLCTVFAHTNINAIQPAHLLRYFHERTAKKSAKQEMRLLSLVCNWARARGYMLAPNPVTGILKQLKVETRRKIYVSDDDFQLVYSFANDTIKDAMDIAYMTGQRVSDVLAMKWKDISDGVLSVMQKKTGETVRIAVTGSLADVFSRIKKRPILNQYIVTKKGRPISVGTFERMFQRTRDKVIMYAQKNGIDFQPFQFRDIRAKAATDSESQTSAQKLLGHRNISTTTIYRRDRKEVVEPLNSETHFRNNGKMKASNEGK